MPEGFCFANSYLSSYSILRRSLSSCTIFLSHLCGFRVYQDFNFFPSSQRNVFHRNRFALGTGNTRNEDNDRVELAKSVCAIPAEYEEAISFHLVGGRTKRGCRKAASQEVQLLEGISWYSQAPQFVSEFTLTTEKDKTGVVACLQCEDR